MTIELPSGEVRRFEASEVQAVEHGGAAPAIDAGGAPVSASAVATDVSQPAGVPMRLESRQVGLTVHRRVGFSGGHAEYELVCAPPCDAQTVPGDQNYAVSLGEGAPVPVSSSLRLDTRSIIDVFYDDRSGLRIAGWSTLVAGTVVGGVISVVGFTFRDNWTDQGRPIMGGIGLGVAAVSVAIGIILIVQDDQAVLSRVREGDVALLRW